VIDKFYQKKKDKQEREEREQAYRQMGLSDEEAKAASRDKDLANQFINKMNADRNFNEASQLRNLQMQQLRESMKRQKDDDLLADKARQKEEAQAQIYDRFLMDREMVNMPIGGGETNHLMKNVPPPTIQVPQGGYKGNRFFQTEQGKSDFTSLVDAGIDASDALEMASKREAQFLASQPKPMSDKEREELIKLRIANRKGLIDLDRIENPKPTANLAYTEATLNAISDAENTLNNSKFATGFFGNMLKDIAGTDAANLRASIDTIKASIGFDRLQKMREDSPTGGALGQVSERELAQLNASLGSLEQSQDAEQFRRNLVRVKDHYQKYYKATMAQVKAYEQGLKFETEEEAMSWYDKNFPMGGQPAPDNQTNIITKGGFVLTAPGN
jgi:hypothetical protein